MIKRELLMRTAMVSVAVSLAMPGVASAQDTEGASPRSGGLSEIVVTAQRRAENIQDVPVAVTALDSNTLDNMRVKDVQNLSGLAPNLQISSQGIQSIPTISMRGINSGTSDNAVDPKIGVYLDGVYIGRSVGAIFDLADIQQVEVLRGPQGTLFGRNATGGAISLVTAKPTGEFGVKAMASYGNQDSLRFRTTVNLPAMGPLSVKVSYLHDESHGWMKNKLGGQTMDYSVREPSFGKLTYADRLGARNVDAFQLSAHLDLNDFTADYRFDYTDSKTVGAPVQVLGHTGALAGATGFIFQLQPQYGGTTNLVTGKPLKTVANATSVQPLKVQGHNLTLAWQASDNFTVKSITGFRKFKQKPNAFDLAGTGGLLFTENQLAALLTKNYAAIYDPANKPGPNDHLYTLMTARSTSQKQFTQELQGIYTSDLFDATFGTFYFRERSPALNVLGILQPTVNGEINTTPFDAGLGSGVNDNIATNKSYAAYAQATFHVTDKFDIALGGRFTKDKRKMDLRRTGSPGTGSGGILPPGVYRKTFNEFTYTAIATYRPTSEITGYAKISTGYVAGGILSAIPYDPEKLTSYELGLKTELFDRRLRANFAAFLMDYKDMQIQTFQDGVQRFENAGKARIWGLEAELTAVPTDGLTLEANIGYTNFKYKEYLSAAAGGGVEDVSDLAVPTYSPKWNMRYSAQYNFPEFSSGGHIMARLDGRYRSTVALGTFPPDTADLAARAVSKGHWIVDGRIGLVDMPVMGTKMGVSLWGQNLLDKDDVGLFGPTAIVQTIQYINGRTYGLELNLAF